MPCCVPNCRTGYRRTKYFPDKVTLPLFSFPSNEERRRAWIEAIPRPQPWNPTKESRVCSAHFPPEDIKTRDIIKCGFDTIVIPLERPCLVDTAWQSHPSSQVTSIYNGHLKTKSRFLNRCIF